jgi:large subunit ribosomal protein L4
MTSITVKTIDLKSLESGSKDFNLAYELELSSPKSVAYAISWQLTKRRAGTAKIKTMAEISGTTAKPHNQKGTGRARQGSKRSVQFRGGRACHGPLPRSFDYSLPKKIVKIALFDILKLKLKENKVVIYNNSQDLEMKTAKLNKIVKDNNISSALIVYNADLSADNLIKSARNLKNIKVLSSNALNVYDIVSFDYLLIDNQVFDNINGAMLQ